MLAWLRASSAGSHQVDALELVADEEHVVLGATTKPARSSPASSRLFTAFTVDDGQIVQLRDFACAPRPSPSVAAATTTGVDGILALVAAVPGPRLPVGCDRSSSR